MKPLSICIAILTFRLVASGYAQPPAIVTEVDADRRIALRTGEELVLALKSNPSTGYRWVQANTVKPVLVVLGKPAYEAVGSLPGAGGVESWKFRAVKPGVQTLKLDYRRPWEKSNPPAKTIVLHISIR